MVKEYHPLKERSEAPWAPSQGREAEAEQEVLVGEAAGVNRQATVAPRQQPTSAVAEYPGLGQATRQLKEALPAPQASFSYLEPFNPPN